MIPYNKISLFVENQFPEFYKEEGKNFIQFVKAYFEWLEQTGNVLDLSENLINYRDIDTTADTFLSHFQNEYLFGVSNVIGGDKRFLIKHILDLYRSKGTIQGCKLLFRLIYNKDADIYLPSDDTFRPSDNTWYAPKFLEVTNNDMNKTLVGKRIKGATTGVEAVVETYVQQIVNEQIISVLYLSNISGGSFRKGEKVIDINLYDQIAYVDAPKIKGSIKRIDVISGGQGFNVGDILVPKTASGRDAELKVTETREGTGTLLFNIDVPGTYYSLDAEEVISRRGGITSITINSGGTGYSNSDTFAVSGEGTGAVGSITTNGSGVITAATVSSAGAGYYQQNTTVVVTTSGGSSANLTATVGIAGRGAAFDIGGITNVRAVTYAHDFIFEYKDTRIDATDYEFQSFLTNANTQIADALTMETKNFGSLRTLTNIATGNNYISPPAITVKDLIYCPNLQGVVYYSNTSYNITGYNTEFLYYYQPGSFIKMTADGYGTNTELRIVRKVVNNTFMELDDKCTYNSIGGVTGVAITNDGLGYANSDTVVFTPQSLVRTNFCYYSEQLGNTTKWTQSNVSITNNAISNPVDGATTAEKLIYNTNNDIHQLVQTTNNNSGNLAFSVYVKPAELSYITLFMDDNAGNSLACDFDLTKLETKYTSYDAAQWLGSRTRIYPEANGWYRCVLQGQKASITIVRVGLALTDYATSFNANGVSVYAGANNTAGIYVFGAQIESAVTATPYIATTSANASVTDSPGSGASANIVTDGVGNITAVNMSNTGSGYYGAPTVSVTTSGGAGAVLQALGYFAGYSVGYPAMQYNFSNTELYDINTNTIGGNNALVSGIPQFGTGIIASAEVKSSGIGYRDNEVIEFATAGAVSNVSIINGGAGYANNENISFSGGGFTRAAQGYVLTNANGTITSVSLTYNGSGYQAEPSIGVITANGSGASLSASIGGLNTTYRITGNIVKDGIGVQKGVWLNNRSFPSVDKYLQDSYYYQEFSYEVQVSMTLNNYVTLLKKIFHPSGLELFGQFVYKDTVYNTEITDSFSVESNEPVNVIPPSLVDINAGDLEENDILGVDVGTWE